MMSCCTFQRCLCMSLHTAGVVIGWLSAVVSLILFMIGMGFLVNLDRIVGSRREFEAAITTEYSILYSMVSAVYFLNFVASMLMIYGVNKNSHRMLLPWLIHNAIVLGLQVFMNTGFFMFVASADPTHYEETISFTIVSIILGIGWLGWTVIFTLFRDIRASKSIENDKGVSNLSNYNLLKSFESEDVKRY